MSHNRPMTVATALAAALALALFAVPALGATSVATFTAPPVPLLSPTPVDACIGEECENTPELASVSLVVTANVVTSGLVPPAPPLILPVACPGEAAEGTAVAVIATERGKLTVSTNLLGVLANGMPYLETLEPQTVRSKGVAAVLVSACTEDGDEADDEDEHRG